MGLQEGYSANIDKSALMAIYAKGDGCDLRTGGPKSIIASENTATADATVTLQAKAPTLS
jgi:hypothetical protein